MAAEKVKLGRIACPGCGHAVMLRENATHTLSTDCDDCDLHTYAKQGSSIAGTWRAKFAIDAPIDKPAAAAAPAAPVRVAKKREAFSLDSV